VKGENMATRRTSFARRLADGTRDSVDSLKESIEDTKERTEDLVKKNPWTAVAIAAAVGAVVALGVSSFAKRDNRPLVRKLRDYFE
jgi:ElaB/YqjD/DUF883 family membrane-anchored ribosome-binding protein